MITKLFSLLLGALCLSNAGAFDYNISYAGDLVLGDNSTGIGGIVTLFTGDVTLVFLDGVEWEPSGVEGGDETITFQTFLNGQLASEGLIPLTDVNRELPTQLEVGFVQTQKCKWMVDTVVRHGRNAVLWD